MQYDMQGVWILQVQDIRRAFTSEMAAREYWKIFYGQSAEIDSDFDTKGVLRSSASDSVYWLPLNPDPVAERAEYDRIKADEALNVYNSVPSYT